MLITATRNNSMTDALVLLGLTENDEWSKLRDVKMQDEVHMTGTHYIFAVCTFSVQCNSYM